MKLTPVMEKFVLHWGEMGCRWGVTRAVAQAHALLMLSPRPLPADEIAETLGVARSNVSTSLKELQGWGLARIVHVFGDRREHFATLDDVWEMFQVILRERKKRELDPTLTALRACAADVAAAGGGTSKADKATTEHFARRLDGLIEFIELSSSWAERGQSLAPKNAKRLFQLGDKIFRLVG